jgi:hypothetical protein
LAQSGLPQPAVNQGGTAETPSLVWDGRFILTIQTNPKGLKDP